MEDPRWRGAEFIKQLTGNSTALVYTRLFSINESHFDIMCCEEDIRSYKFTISIVQSISTR